MATCSPSSSLSPSSDSSPPLSANQMTTGGSAFSAFQPLMMHQQLLALLSAQFHSNLPIPSATLCKPEQEEPMDTSHLIDSTTSLKSALSALSTSLPPLSTSSSCSSASSLIPHNTLLTTASKLHQQPITVSSSGSQYRTVKREERLPSESPSSTVSSPRKRTADLDKTSPNDHLVEEEYLERRRKNNDSARRSREVRRLREQANRDRMQILEVENGQLRQQLASLRVELSQLQLVLISGGVTLPACVSQANSDSSTSPTVSE